MKKRLISLLLVVMCLSLSLTAPAQAYAGNEAMSSGDADVVDAIILNLLDYTVRVAEEEADIVLTISDPASLFVDATVEKALLAVPGYGPALSKVYSYTKMTAEAAWELGEALAEANSTRRDLLYTSLKWALSEQGDLIELATNAYLVGAADYAKGRWQPVELGFDVETQTAETVQLLRENARHVIFLFDSESRERINAAADALEDLAESLPSMTEMYQMGYEAAKAKAKTGYNASAAVAYADAHWDDGVGLCAQFVCDCLEAGGISIPDESYYKTTDASYDNCNGALGAYVNPYVAAPALLKYLGEVLGYTVIKNPEESQMELGDIVFMYPKTIGTNPDSHVVIITKVEDGQAYFSAHNTDRHNRGITSDWCSYLVKMNGEISNYVGDTETTEIPETPEVSGNTKTQYRYHMYVNENGRRYVCPYYGQLTYPGTTFTLQYTEWLDEPLEINNGKYNSYAHAKDSSCASYGCIDPSWEGNRYMDADGLTWVCEETRQVEVDANEDVNVNDAAETVVMFADVSETAWFADAVNWAASNGITSGIGSGLFAPDGQCTRGQVVTFLWRAAGCPEPVSTTNPFTDVSTDSYYYKAVLWAVEQGITQGTSATTFSPEGPCTRSQAVTFLWRFRGSPAMEGVNCPFNDVTEGQWYFSAVSWALGEAITQGTTATTFSPDGTCTRGQIVTFLYRCMKP